MSYSVLNTKKVIDVIKYRWIWLTLSLILLLPGLFAMFWSIKVYPTHTPLLVGIDFTGGTIIQYSVNEEVSVYEIGKKKKKILEKEIENPVF